MMAVEDEIYKMLDLLKFWGKDAPGKLPQTTAMEQSTGTMAKTIDDSVTGGMAQAALKGDDKELLKQALINAALYGGPSLVGKGVSKAVPILGPKAIRVANRWVANLEEFLYPTKTDAEIKQFAQELMNRLHHTPGDFLPDIARIEREIADAPGSGLAGWAGPNLSPKKKPPEVAMTTQEAYEWLRKRADEVRKHADELNRAQKMANPVEIFERIKHYTDKYLPAGQHAFVRLMAKLNEINQPQEKLQNNLNEKKIKLLESLSKLGK
ncbi:MAG: hypothetical protein FJ343_07600 [Sphingomonadales bacterium]|nr:hypothetical protein [Sphingomonadales bacterium]